VEEKERESVVEDDPRATDANGKTACARMNAISDSSHVTVETREKKPKGTRECVEIGTYSTPRDDPSTHESVTPSRT
jgi:hypothetical protein